MAAPAERRSRVSTEKDTALAETDEAEQTVSGPDVAIIKFTPEDEDLLKIKKGEHLTIDRPWTTVPKTAMLPVLHKLGRERAVRRLKSYDHAEVLVGFQAALTPTEGHLVCLTERGRERVLSELSHLHSTLAEKVKRYLLRSTQSYPQPEVEPPVVQKKRPPINYEWVGQVDSRPSKIRFGTAKVSRFYCRILFKNKESIKLIESAIQDNEVLATPSVSDVAVQTEPEISINDCTQFVPEIDLPSFTRLTTHQEHKLANVFQNYKDIVMEATAYNSLFDLYKDDYSELLQKGTPLTLSRLGHYTHFVSFNDISQFEGKILTSISWHPHIPGAVAVAYGNLNANNTVRLESDSEAENYRSRGDELETWAKTGKVVTVEDKNTTEKDNWLLMAKRIEHSLSMEYSEDQWAASEVTLDSIEAGVRLRNYEVHAQKMREDLIPFYDAGPDEYDMYYVPYGLDVGTDRPHMKKIISTGLLQE